MLRHADSVSEALNVAEISAIESRRAEDDAFTGVSNLNTGRVANSARVQGVADLLMSLLATCLLSTCFPAADDQLDQ